MGVAWGVWVGMGLLVGAYPTPCQEPWRFALPEQRQLEIRDPSQFAKVRFPDLPPPTTVKTPEKDVVSLHLSLDEAIRMALDRTEVVRVLAGVTAVSSGRTIYDPAISNTQIDAARARFDPRFGLNNNFFRNDDPSLVVTPPAPAPPSVTGVPQHAYDMQMGLAKDTATGGTASMSVRASPIRDRFMLPGQTLNPRAPSSTELSYTQPLLQGAGVRANTAPIVIARIDTERSFFQLKDSVQRMVRGVVEGYWALVLARVEAWAVRQQVEQGQEAFERAAAALEAGLGTAAELAQARSALATFRANLITAEANVLQREAALRNLLGLPPAGKEILVPVTPMATDRVEPQWDALLALAAQQRPDLIELKLILEADQQRLDLARNQALPRLDAVALYRWNGFEGRLPDGAFLRADPNDFTEWQLGVNFSVPLGLRRERAALRQQELLIMHDRANLEQGLHAAAHELAESLRNLAQYYEQYQAFSEARQAAWANLEYQLADYREGRGTLYLNVLQAITNWGNSVSAEAQALARYNVELAYLEERTGTILESHGIRFLEERFYTIGPLGRAFRDRPYPQSSPLSASVDRYPSSEEASEKALKIDGPAPPRRGQAEPPAAPLPSPNPQLR